MSSNQEACADRRSEEYDCPLCRHILNDPAKLICGHIYCCSCVVTLHTEFVQCRACSVYSSSAQIVIDEVLKERIGRLVLTCRECRSSECTKIRPPDPVQHSQRTVHVVDASPSSNLLSCPLLTCGCLKKFSPEEQDEHYTSTEHLIALYYACQSLQVHREDAQHQQKINPDNANESAADNRSLTIPVATMKRVTNIIQEAIHSLNLDACTAAMMQNDNPTRIVQQIDRGGSDVNDSLSTLAQMNEVEMNSLPSSAASSIEEPQAPGMSAAQSIVHSANPFSFLSDSNSSRETIAVNNGLFAWCIDDVEKKIHDAVARIKECTESPVFQTPNGDQNIRVLLYLNGKNNNKTLAIRLVLNIPMRAGFHGDVKFTLVDQSKAEPRDHITRTCFGSLNEIGDRLGSDAFTDKNLLHVDPSRYIQNNKIIWIVQLRAAGDTHFANFPAGVRDVLSLQ